MLGSIDHHHMACSNLTHAVVGNKMSVLSASRCSTVILPEYQILRHCPKRRRRRFVRRPLCPCRSPLFPALAFTEYQTISLVAEPSHLSIHNDQDAG